MGILNRHRALMTLAGLLLAGMNLRAADKVGITLINDGTDDIYVTLYDMNTHPRSKLLAHQLISGFASVPISVTADSQGNGHVYWTAATAGADVRQCGNKDKASLRSEASVHVYARSNCPARPSG